jgi:hypothetical protein
VTQAVLDLRSWELEDNARWAEVELPGGVAARRVAVRMRSRSGCWMSVGEIEVLQDGYNASGYVISNVFDLGAEGRLSVQWEAARPSNTSVDFKVRSGNTPEPDGTWTAYTSMGQNTIVAPAMHGRYVQYRADLRTGLANNYNVTPILTRVRFNNLQRVYYVGNDGSADRILSAISLDGVAYSAESGARVEPGGAFSSDGVSDPVFIPVSGGTALGNLSSIQASLSNLAIDATGIQLVPVFGTNYAASGQGTTVLWDEDRYNDSYLAQYGIEGDHGANRASRYAGRDAGGPVWTIDFDLGQERQLGGVQMLRHDSSYEVTGFKIYGATVYSTTGEDDYAGFSLIYNSPTYAAGTDHAAVYPLVTARYIRLAMDRWANSHPEFAEFELYGEVGYATEGVYVTKAVRVGEQGVSSVALDADIPAGCQVKVEARTGPTLIVDSHWSEFVDTPIGISLRDPALSGEYAIFRITLQSDSNDTPLVRGLRVNGLSELYFTGVDSGASRILSAVSLDGLNWIQNAEPVIDVGGILGFENVASPDVRQLLDGSWVLYFRGEKGGKWGIYRATSSSGSSWSVQSDAILSLEPGETGFGSTQYLPLLDGTDRLYFTSFTGNNPRILSAASAPEGQVEVDNIPPDVAIAFPQAGSILTGGFQVTGTATDRNYLNQKTNFVQYTFDLSGDGGQSWNSLATGINPVVNDVLAVLSTQAFADGDYLLRLTAEDLAGNTSQTQVAVVFENGAPPRPIITAPTVHGVPVTMARSPITVEGFAAANTRVQGFLTTEAGARRSIGTVDTAGGNAIPQTYSDSNFLGGSGVAFDAKSADIAITPDGSVVLALDESTSNILWASGEYTASSEWSASYRAELAFDNNFGTYWASFRNATSAWLNVHWPEARTIGGCRIYWRTSGSSKDFKIQALVNGSYVDLITSTVTSGSVAFFLEGIETTDLRIYSDTITGQDIEIQEFQVFGLLHRRKNVAAEANGGKLLSFTSQYNGSDWAAANVLRGLGNYWATTNLAGATTPQSLLIELNTDGQPTVSIDRLVVHNYGQASDRYCSERFELAYSVTDTAPESFVSLIPGTLEKRTGAQVFDFPPTDAKYVKFTVLSGYDPSYWELDEIEIYRAGSSGVLVSTVKGSGAIDNFNQIEFFAQNNEETSVRVEVRSGNVIPANDAVYTPWTAVRNGDIIPDSLNAKYIQYRAFLESTDPTITPVLEEVRITTVGEYGNWAIPNVDIQGGTNTITAVAIDISDESVSDEALPIEVSLDVVDVVANRDKDAYGVNQDVAIDLDVTSPPATPGQALGERIFTAHLRILDDLGFIVNADGAGNANYEILQAPFWVDESLPASATYSETFEWTTASAYRSAQSHTSSSTETLSEHSFSETSNALQILTDCRLVQYVYLDPAQTPEEIMLELITDGPANIGSSGARTGSTAECWALPLGIEREICPRRELGRGWKSTRRPWRLKMPRLRA